MALNKNNPYVDKKTGESFDRKWFDAIEWEKKNNKTKKKNSKSTLKDKMQSSVD